MRLSSSSTLLAVSFLLQQQQQPLSFDDLRNAGTYPAVKQVAIIGAGAAGSSAAYHLRRFAAESSIAVNITIYDSNPYIGGRSTTVHPFDSPSQPPLELGASIFVQVNQILVNATREFNLSTESMMVDLVNNDDVPDLGVYDGTRIVLVQASDSYWDLAKLVWKYGLAPWRTIRLMRETVGKFLQMYSAPIFPFADLTAAVAQTGLADILAVTGDVFLGIGGISPEFSHDVIQASTRVNYAQNLDVIHGLETMVCMATDGAMSIDGGNWRIFAGMVEASGAVRALGTKVHAVRRIDQGRLEVEAGPTARDDVPGDNWTATFDHVVLAAPMQFTGIEWPSDVHRPDVIPYVQLHVTLFTSPHDLEPTAFGLAENAKVPRALLTTTPAEGMPGPDFLSISLLRDVVNPITGGMEHAYKIFTLQPVNATFIRRILGIRGAGEDIPKVEVGWIHRKVWHSYPLELPRVTFESTRLARDLWYTAGMESFISTMETSSLMGMNVARLVVDEWIGGAGAADRFHCLLKARLRSCS
ncbi:hypothetical protein ANO11243_073730 [Dothideomycetidae sp. 11243]|nr:hypothetical protein ANO11243_073730 [fungal sp. No.11243]